MLESVILMAKGHLGKNKLATLRHAAPSWDGTWIVGEESESVTFALGRLGPWLMLVPSNVPADVAETHSHWVLATDDPLFSVERA